LVIKTFERPKVLRRMLESVRQVYSGPIIIADDSASPFACNDPLVTVLELPFDSGVAIGRNALIDSVDTEYLWMADDDMILLPDFDIAKPLEYMNRNRDVDLYGGRVINLPQWESPDYAASVLFAYRGQPCKPLGTMVDGLPVYYKVPNFYVARTEQVRMTRYDSRLRRVDHNDFFTSAYGRLLCVYDSAWVVLHAHSLFDHRYQSFRMNQEQDLTYLARKWRFGASD
jgi:glycosyltransferase involved in cell wall biosynthesis